MAFIVTADKVVTDYGSEFWPDESRNLLRTILCTGVSHRLQQSHKTSNTNGRDKCGREGSQHNLCRSGVANDADDHHHTAHQQSAGPAPRTSIEYDLIDMHGSGSVTTSSDYGIVSFGAMRHTSEIVRVLFLFVSGRASKLSGIAV